MKKHLLSLLMLSAFATSQLSAETPFEHVQKVLATPKFQQKASQAGTEVFYVFCKTSLLPLIAVLITLI
jgi:hypothetical protein